MRKQFLVIFTLLYAGVCGAQTLPDIISKDFYMARYAVSNAQW
jgi:hypothetical protein